MLFRKDIEPSCLYCKFGRTLSENEVGCEKHGIVSAHDSCSRFRYDPLRRTPETAAPLKSAGLSEDDFTL